MKKIAGTAGAVIALIMLFTVGIAVVFLSVPIIVMATIDYGLQAALGFDNTSAILEEQAEHVVAHQLKRGYFNDSLAADFEKQGVEVGQVTLAGDFVRTNNYSAELNAEVASDGVFYDHSTGELAMRFEGEIIVADDFVAKVESNPRLYMAFATATDMTARYYYSKEVSQVYKDFGLSRSNFANWEGTGDRLDDQAQFEEIFNRAIDNVMTEGVGLNGKDIEYEELKAEWDACMSAASTDEEKEACGPEPIDRSFTTEDENEGSGTALAGNIREHVVGEEANEKAKSLLNVAISSNEPYVSAATFGIIEEGLNKARIDGDGPVDPLLNTLSEPNEIVVTNAWTGEDMVTDASITRTPNFLATVNGRGYDVDSAEHGATNYSRDRVLQMTEGVPNEIINKTTIATDEKSKANNLIRIAEEGETDEIVMRSSNSLSKVFYEDTYTVTKSTVGGNRVVMGGSFLSNSINLHTLGSMPSDEGMVARYKEEVDKVMARRAEAERATLSPFDISSKNTFLGSLVHQFGLIAVQNFSKGRSAGVNAVSSIASLFGQSVTALTSNTVLADAKESYLTTNGAYCPVIKTAAEVAGDMYCNSHNTSNVELMHLGLGDYIAMFEGMIDEEGNIVEDSDLGKFVEFGMKRESTVGLQDAAICEIYRERYAPPWVKILDAIDGLFALLTERDPLHEACWETLEILGMNVRTWEVPSGIANGACFTMSKHNNECEEEFGYNGEIIGLYSSYMLYNMVASLLDEKESAAWTYMEKVYAKRPRDNSPAGVLARRSGMSKSDAQIALNYASYLDYIARYQPETRYAFSAPEFDYPEDDLLFENKRLQEELAILSREIFYRDLRGLVTFSV